MKKVRIDGHQMTIEMDCSLETIKRAIKFAPHCTKLMDGDKEVFRLRVVSDSVESGIGNSEAAFAEETAEGNAVIYMLNPFGVFTEEDAMAYATAIRYLSIIEGSLPVAEQIYESDRALFDFGTPVADEATPVVEA